MLLCLFLQNPPYNFNRNNFLVISHPTINVTIINNSILLDLVSSAIEYINHVSVSLRLMGIVLLMLSHVKNLIKTKPYGLWRILEAKSALEWMFTKLRRA